MSGQASTLFLCGDLGARIDLACLLLQETKYFARFGMIAHEALKHREEGLRILRHTRHFALGPPHGKYLAIVTEKDCAARISGDREKIEAFGKIVAPISLRTLTNLGYLTRNKRSQRLASHIAR